MGQWFKQPVLSVVLLLSWLLLAEGFTSVGQWILGSVLALVIPRLIQSWWLPAPRIQSWSALAIFFWRVLIDIIQGNIEVTRMALGRQERLEPKFLDVETALESDMAIFMMMSAISLAPGTALTGYDESTRTIKIHALHCSDAEALKASFHERYEVILQRIFAC